MKSEARATSPSTLHRTGILDARGIREEARAVPLSFSSETRSVTNDGVPQILLHERGAVDFSGLDSGLYHHDVRSVVGKVANVHLDVPQRKGRAEVIFDTDPESDTIFSKIKSGSIQGVSVGLRVNEW